MWKCSSKLGIELPHRHMELKFKTILGLLHSHIVKTQLVPDSYRDRTQ